MEDENNKQNKEQSVKDRVLEAVQSGKVKMRPNWYFVGMALLGALGTAIVVLAVLFFASAAFFTLWHTGVWFAPIFGARGWFVFFQTLPWLLILLAGLALVVLETLVHRYPFVYRMPVLISLIAIIFVAAVGGLLLAKTPMHKNIISYSESQPVAAARGFYRRFERPMERNVFVGRITEMAADGFVMESPRRDTVKIIIVPATRLPLGAGFSVGDTVVVFGDLRENGVEAYGIREVENDEFFIFNLEVPNASRPAAGPGPRPIILPPGR